MKSAPEPRKHHYLPQFYLKCFSVDGHGIFQVEKRHGRFYGCQIKDIAAIRDYHELDGEDTSDRYALEKALSRDEAVQAEHLREVLASGISSELALGNIVQLLAIMRMRVPAVKEHINRSYASTVRASALVMQRSGRLPKPPPGLEDKLKVENLAISVHNWKCLEVMFRMGTSDRVLSGLARMRATLLRAPFGERFLTSDQPVAVYHPTRWKGSYGAGPETPGSEVSFPLSSRALLLLDHQPYGHEERTATSAEVQEFNRRTVVMADQYVFIGEAPDHALKATINAGQMFAGFRFDSLDDGKGFLQVHGFTPVGPAPLHE